MQLGVWGISRDAQEARLAMATSCRGAQAPMLLLGPAYKALQRPGQPDMCHQQPSVTLGHGGAPHVKHKCRTK